MNWRPETWKNPYAHAAPIALNKPFNHDYDIYEAGADAMLEALKEKKVPTLYLEQWKSFKFIPDEEEK